MNSVPHLEVLHRTPEDLDPGIRFDRLLSNSLQHLYSRTKSNGTIEDLLFRSIQRTNREHMV